MEQITKKLFIERLKNEKNILVGSITVNSIEKLEDVIKLIDKQKERLYSMVYCKILENGKMVYKIEYYVKGEKYDRRVATEIITEEQYSKFVSSIMQK